MNRFINPFLACLVVAACLLSSCERDDYWVGKTENPNLVPLGVDEAAYLRNAFLELDEDGSIVGTFYGVHNASKPGEVVITVRKYAEAVEIMKSIIPDFADSFEEEDRLVWNLKDVDGSALGQAVLKPSTAVGEVAAVEVPACASPLTRVVFKKPLLTDSWQEVYNNCDALDPYYLGATISVRKDKLPEGSMEDGLYNGQGDFLVVREYEAGVHSGILVRLEDKEYNIVTVSNSDKSLHRSHSTYYCVLYFIHRILKENPAFLDTMKSLGMADWDNGFYYNTQGNYEARFNMKTTDTTELNLFCGWYYREALVYRFEPREMKDGSIKVWIVRDRIYQEKF